MGDYNRERLGRGGSFHGGSEEGLLREGDI